MSNTARVPGLFDLTGKVAVVTGASSGLGEGARRLDRLEVLAKEVDTGAPGEGLLVPVRCDVTNEEDRAALVRVAAGITGRVDVLVNNAGMAGVPNAEDETAAGFAALLDLNLAAGFHLATAVAATVPEGGSLSIVNISSVIGMVSTAPIGGASYAASKAGVIGLTRELAGQWGRRGIRVNAIVPGWFDTEMTDGLFSNDKSAGWVRRNTMLGRGGEPGEVDGALLFLASEASSYVTGHTLVVDGGWTAR
jgi:hypothetical protein